MPTSTSTMFLRTALLHGIPAGAVAIGSIILGLQIGGTLASSEAFGYLSMLIALSLIFVGTKRYRDNELGGVISFTKALLLGLSISFTAGIFYTLVWEIYTSISGNNFLESYLEGLLEAKKAEGVTGVALEAYVAQLDAMRIQYSKPINRLFITFLEIFPVGLLVSLLSAGLLRNSGFLPAVNRRNSN